MDMILEETKDTLMCSRRIIHLLCRDITEQLKLTCVPYRHSLTYLCTNKKKLHMSTLTLKK